MANAAIVPDNNLLAAAAVLSASSQELTMPVSQLLTAQPAERWRSTSGTASLLFDKGSLILADTVMLGGLTCGAGSTIQLRLSTVDATGAAGDVYDSGVVVHGSRQFDYHYGMFLDRLSAPASYRYVRFDITDPDAAYVEAGTLLDGLAEAFSYNFVPGGTWQWTDLSRVEKAASGKTLTWPDNKYRTTSLNFDWISASQRYGLMERLDRDKGLTTNVLLMTDTDSTNLPRDSVYGLMTDLFPVSYGQIFDIFGKQVKIEERI